MVRSRDDRFHAAALVDRGVHDHADRTLTKGPITPADQAEAYFLLVTKRLSKSTGQVVTVDGGLHEAFLRRLRFSSGYCPGWET